MPGGLYAGRIANCMQAPGQVRGHRTGAQAELVAVRMTVQCHLMSRGGYLGGKAGVALGHRAQHEESGLPAELVQGPQEGGSR